MRYLRALFERCLAEESVNSRLMFFLHGLVISLGTLALVIAFIFVKDKTGYDYMVGALGASGGIGAVGRFMTKKGGSGGAGEGESTPPASG